MRVDFPYLMADIDRHGNRRYYVRRYGHKIRIRARPGTEAFAQAYADAVATIDRGDETRGTIRGAPAGTLGWLAASYFVSAEYRGLDEQSRRTRRAIIESCLREPRKPGLSDLMRNCPINMLKPSH